MLVSAFVKTPLSSDTTVATSVPLSLSMTLLFFFVFPLTITLSLVIADHFSGVVMVILSVIPVPTAVPVSSIRIVTDPTASSTASVTLRIWFQTFLNTTPLLSFREPLLASVNWTLRPAAGIVAPKSVSDWK